MLSREDIAIYAATLSTILLIIKIYEMWKDRFRLEAWLTIDGPDHDKEIKIVNLSKTPIYIKRIELFWSRSGKEGKKSVSVNLGYDVAVDIQVGPYLTKGVHFTEADNFPIKRGCGNLYARFIVAGRKGSFIKKIYE
jgi:hypothetical protein